jgi:hypothetical protein
MMTPEGKVKKVVRDLLARYDGLYSEWPVPSGYGRATIDCMGCYRGRFFGIETKAPGGKTTPRQDISIAAMRAAGGEVFVIDGDVTQLKEWLDAHRDRAGES